MSICISGTAILLCATDLNIKASNFKTGREEQFLCFSKQQPNPGVYTITSKVSSILLNIIKQNS
jgi:hypothetical protein